MRTCCIHRVQTKSPFDANRLYSAEILSILLQSEDGLLADRSTTVRVYGPNMNFVNIFSLLHTPIYIIRILTLRPLNFSYQLKLQQFLFNKPSFLIL